MEKEIKIVADDGNVITYQEIYTNTISRMEVTAVDAEISALNDEVLEKSAKLDALKDKVTFQKDIIEFADSEKETVVEEAIVNE